MTKGKPPILMRREGNRLAPADAWALEQMDGIREGEEVHVRVTRVRSRGKLNLWWAGLALAVDNLDDERTKLWPSARKFHNAILRALGYVERVHWFDGTHYDEVPDSIAIDNMDEAEFEILFEKARPLMLELIGYDPWEAWKAEHQIAQFGGMR